jgi:hypothetical protein
MCLSEKAKKHMPSKLLIVLEKSENSQLGTAYDDPGPADLPPPGPCCTLCPDTVLQI